MSSKKQKFTYRNRLEGHGNWVTALAPHPEKPNLLVSGSRDKSLMIWDTDTSTPLKSLHGHSHFVSDLVLSSDGNFALSSSWDHTLRLWDITQGVSTNRFVGHTKDVLSVSLSVDNRQIVSGSRDHTVKLWNTLGKDMYTLSQNGHSEWVSSVRFAPTTKENMVVSGSWDKTMKVWDVSTCELKFTGYGHNSSVNAIAISPDGSLCASGGRDGHVMLWDLYNGTHLKSLPTYNTDITCLIFSPSEYILVAGTSHDVIIWNLQNKQIYARLKISDPEKDGQKTSISCQSIAFSADGSYLYAGCSDGSICVWDINLDIESNEEEKKTE